MAPATIILFRRARYRSAATASGGGRRKQQGYSLRREMFLDRKMHFRFRECHRLATTLRARPSIAFQGLEAKLQRKRNRSRPADSFEVRLQNFARDARAAARQVPPGRERDALLKKARQTENVLEVSAMLAGRDVQASK
jgi:hypothetical protein